MTYFSASAPRRVFGYDLIRATGILCLLCAHSLRNKFADVLGMLSAEMFFALSGFLVGEIFLKAMQRDQTMGALLWFWVRRWLRTLPLYYFFLLLSVGLHAHLAVLPPWESILKHVFFVQSWLSPPAPYFGQSWTLAVEEWFYLLVPLVAFLGLRFTTLPQRALYLGAALSFLILPLLLRYGIALQEPNYTWRHGFRKLVLFRLDAPLGGFLLAVVNVYYPALLKRYARQILGTGLALILATTAILFSPLELESLFGRTGFFTVQALGCACLLVGAAKIPCPSALITRSVQWLALLSYALYLANNLVLRLAYHFGASGSTLVVFFWAGTFALAWSASILVERPSLRLRERYFPEDPSKGPHTSSATNAIPS